MAQKVVLFLKVRFMLHLHEDSLLNCKLTFVGLASSFNVIHKKQVKLF